MRIRMWTVVGLVSLLVACGGGGGGGSGGIGLEDIDGDGEIVILAFGDSITRGTGDGSSANQAPSGPAGYPVRLQESLGVTVINQGKPGEQTREGKVRLGQVLSSTAADYVILLEGANDILNGRDSQAFDNLVDMVGMVFEAGAQPVMATLTPTCCNHETTNPPERVEALSTRIRDFAKQQRLPVIDFLRTFVPVEGVPYDETSGLIHVPEGLHPTPTGYDVMADAAASLFR